MSVADLKKAMEKGAISADMVTLAFKSATSAGGLFYGNLEAQSQTLQGRISTLKDNFVTALQNMAEAFLPLLKSGVDVLIAFDWTPIVAKVQAFGNALSSIPFDELLNWVRRLSILVVAFATRDLQVTLVNAFMKAAAVGSSAFQNMTLSFTGFRNIAVTGAKSIGLAMKTALGPIGIALLAIEGFVEAYNWLEGKTRAKATEEQRANARKYMDQQLRASNSTKTREEIMADVVGQQEARKAKLKKLQEKAALGGPEGVKASKELQEVQLEITKRASFVNAMKDVYKEMTGMEFEVKAGAVKTPSMTSDTAELKKQFEEIEKGLKESVAATKKQTKATEANTKAQEKFDISSLSRQAFDAAFNVKLKEFAIGAI
jgi:hypothetical protein